MKPLNLAVIGTGNIWWAVHAKNLARLSGCTVAAICDPSEAARARCASELGARTYASVAELFAAEPDLDAVISCAPPSIRRQAVQAAADRKLPLFVEKPPAANLDDARENSRIIAEANIPVSVGFMWRYLPAADRMRELLQGRQILHVQSEFFCPAITRWGLPAWFLNKSISGGHIMDQAIHVLDLVRYVAGEITEVMSFGSNVVKPKDAECTVEESSSTIFRLGGGGTGAHLHSWVHDHTGGLITVRTQDSRLTLFTSSKLEGILGGESIHEDTSPEMRERSAHFRELETFINAVRSGDFTLIRSPYPDAARSQAVVAAVNDSMDTNLVRTVETI